MSDDDVDNNNNNNNNNIDNNNRTNKTWQWKKKYHQILEMLCMLIR